MQKNYDGPRAFLEASFVDRNDAPDLFENELGSTRYISVTSVPVLTQPIPTSAGSNNAKHGYNISITDNTGSLQGSNILQAMGITTSPYGGLPIDRRITFSTPNAREVLRCEYACKSTRPGFPLLQFSSPYGNINPEVYFETGPFLKSPGKLGFICPCICPCLCCCCPTSNIVMKSKTSHETLLVGEEWVAVARKLDFSRPADLNGAKVKIGSMDTSKFKKNQSMKIEFKEGVPTVNEKLLMIGLVVGMLDYQVVQKTARKGTK